MAAYAQYSSPSPPPRRYVLSQPSSPMQAATFDDAEDFLSSDLDISFASTMSITSAPNSPTATGHDLFLERSDRMDISPYDGAQPEPINDSNNKGSTRQLARRPFGTEVSNTTGVSSPSSPMLKAPSARPRSNTVLPPLRRPLFERSGSSSQKSTGPRSRAALPGTWLQQPAPLPKTSMRAKRSGAVFSKQAVPLVPPTPSSDAMEVDFSSPAIGFSSPPPSSPLGAAPSAGKTDFSAFFFQPSSPELSSPLAIRPPSYGAVNKKRRSPDLHEDKFNEQEDETARIRPQLFDGPMSSSPPSSPSHKRARARPLERAVTLGGLGQGNLFISRVQNQNVQPLPKRAVPRRPTLLAGVIPAARATSATATLTANNSQAMAPAPARRAFSAVLTARNTALITTPSGMTDDDEDRSSDFEIGPESPAQRAQAARRENVGRLGNRFSASAVPHSPLAAERKPVPGLPGFGDSEADGKILPCHKVREDGLMRITADTLDDLMNGQYDSAIESYQVIDCRFDYEHNGGHIPGSINLNTNDAIEEYLLGSGKPVPSRSGDALGRKIVLVFHCEFSVKRAPTFAKHLRSKDRSMNGHVYPNIHYPEVYILEGGYSQYYNTFPDHCIPSAYVRMDDPAYQRARASDLNDFRRWNRARSFTYGEQRTTGTQQQQQQGAAPSAPSTRPVSTDTATSAHHGLSFAAANAAFGRRHGHGHGQSASNGGSGAGANGAGSLSTLQEDGDSSCTETDVEVDLSADLGDSPCPPSSRTASVAMVLGGVGNVRARGMQRALTTALTGSRR